MSQPIQPHPSSYRDPSGYIFEKDGQVYRQVNQSFKEQFELFNSSGCYERLIKKGLLIPHEVITENLTADPQWYTTLRPAQIPFVSYPYEWSFNMLKDAALLTLQLVKESLACGMILKDATPYNIQWHEGRLLFIDTLSFEKYDEAEPWIAYRQFCECFLSPLLVMHHTKQDLHELMLAYPEGIPLPVTRSLLPWRTKFSLHTYLHIHLHGRVSAKQSTAAKRPVQFSKKKLQNLLLSLETLIRKLRLPDQKSTWSEYYAEASQRESYLEQKKGIIREWIGALDHVRTVADLGANDGVFAQLTAGRQLFTIAADFDPYCIDHLYQEIKSKQLTDIQPLVINLANPSPAIGVNNTERGSFIHRMNADLVMALALIHHLAIGKNIPLSSVARFFASVGDQLIIEFVPRQDEKVQVMLASKKDIYHHYDEAHFISAFEKHYTIKAKQPIGNSGRTLYHLLKNAQ